MSNGVAFDYVWLCCRRRITWRTVTPLTLTHFTHTYVPRFCEYSAHLHEHFVDELKMNGQNYMPPDQPGIINAKYVNNWANFVHL